MSHKNSENISEELLQMTTEQIEQFDQNALDGKALECYENSQVLRPTVFRNKLSGRVGNYFDSFDVEIVIHENEISSSCSCDNSRKICQHAITLLYAWVNDGQDFLDVSHSIKELEKLNKERLVEIIANILRYKPSLVEMFLSREAPDWDEIDRDPLKN